MAPSNCRCNPSQPEDIRRNNQRDDQQKSQEPLGRQVRTRQQKAERDADTTGKRRCSCTDKHTVQQELVLPSIQEEAAVIIHIETALRAGQRVAKHVQGWQQAHYDEQDRGDPQDHQAC